MEEKKGIGFIKGCLIFIAVVAALAIIAIVGFLLLIGVAANKVAEEQKAEVERMNAAPISNVTWEEIDKIYNLQSQFTEIQKKEYWKNYKGKKVKWSGEVSSVNEMFGTICLHVKLNSGTFTSDVAVYLKETEKQNAMELKKGVWATFIGILDDWGSIMPVTLKHGEIIK